MALKCLWKIPRETHREIVSLLSDSLPIQIALYSRFFKFVKTALTGPSKVTASVMRVAQINPQSVFTRNINLAKYIFNVDIDTICSKVIDFKNEWLARTEQLASRVLALRELVLVRHSNTDHLDGFDEDEQEELVFMLAAG